MGKWTMCKVVGGFVVAVLIFVGCSSQLRNTNIESTSFSEKIGNATSYDFTNKSFQHLIKYHYELIRFESNPSQLYLETSWKYRLPFKDEVQLGVEEAKTKIVISARPRKRAILNGSNLNVVRMYAENLVRLIDSDEWIQIPMTNMLKSYLYRVSDDLKTDLLTGIRQF